MKVPSTILTVVLASAGLSQAGAFVPASFASKRGGVGVGRSGPSDGRLAAPNRNLLTTFMSTSEGEEELEKEFKDNAAWSKLIKMKDFDPDDDDVDDEMVMELLDVTIDVLKEDEAKDSFFASALSIIRLLRAQSAKRSSIDFATYGNHPEVSFYVVFKSPYLYLPTSLLTYEYI